MFGGCLTLGAARMFQRKSNKFTCLLVKHQQTGNNGYQAEGGGVEVGPEQQKKGDGEDGPEGAVLIHLGGVALQDIRHYQPQGLREPHDHPIARAGDHLQ